MEFLSSIDWNALFSDIWEFSRPRLATTAAVLAIAVVLFWVVRRVLRRLERFLSEKTRTDFDDIVVQLVRRSLQTVIVFLAASRIAVAWLLPGVANAIVAALIVALSLPASRFVGDVLRRLERRVPSDGSSKLDETALPLVNKFVQFLVVAAAVLIAMQYLGINIAPLLAGAGVVGLALSLAAKDTLSNLIAGVLLILDRPFKVGDRIELWMAPKETGTWGDVLEIGLRATKIRNPDNLVIIVPNNEIMRRDIINYTASGGSIRLRIPIGIAYEADTELAKRTILEAAGETEGVKREPEPIVIVRSFGASQIDLQLRVWIHNARDRRRITDAITERVLELFGERGVEIPYPKRDLYIKTMPPETGVRVGAEESR